MPWLLLLLGLIALYVSFTASSVGLSALCLLAALLLFAVGIGLLLANRVGSRTRDTTQLIDPLELRRMRELVDSRRNSQPDHHEPPRA